MVTSDTECQEREDKEIDSSPKIGDLVTNERRRQRGNEDVCTDGFSKEKGWQKKGGRKGLDLTTVTCRRWRIQ